MKLVYSNEVKNALQNNKPIVALESTIISHGMPYPKNVETALLVEETVRANGAVPATCAIIGGEPTVGLEPEKIEYLGKTGLGVTKVSRRDMPIVTALGMDGATTVAGTMMLADMAGIKLFATGGIGGVHRGAETSMDISADLEELGKTPVAVVCAGVKSILDIGLTLEYLETKGVPVITYKSQDFPAFYTKKSGFKSPNTLNDPENIAKVIAANAELGRLSGRPNGMIIANPIPDEYSMDEAEISAVIADAVAEAERLGVKGKEITPYLLDRIQRLTKGRSLGANIALVLNNAALAAKIAAAMV